MVSDGPPNGNGFRYGSHKVSGHMPDMCLDLLLSCIWALELSWGPHFLVPNGLPNGNGFHNGSQWFPDSS